MELGAGRKAWQEGYGLPWTGPPYEYGMREVPDAIVSSQESRGVARNTGTWFRGCSSTGARDPREFSVVDKASRLGVVLGSLIEGLFEDGNSCVR